MSLDEKIIHVIKHQKVYQVRLKRAYENKIKPKYFQVRDLVLKENINKITTNDEVKGKFELNWLGPYVVIEKIGIWACKLSAMDGKEEN